jgi:hypothetical protein
VCVWRRYTAVTPPNTRTPTHHTRTPQTIAQAEKEFFRPDPNPDYDAIDLRALAEKRAARGALDAEWRRREALLARPYSFTLRSGSVVCVGGKCLGGWVSA